MELYINQGGEVACGRRGHGGYYLNMAVEAGTAGDGVTTPLDSWLRVSPEDAAAHQIRCEECEAGR